MTQNTTDWVMIDADEALINDLTLAMNKPLPEPEVRSVASQTDESVLISNPVEHTSNLDNMPNNTNSELSVNVRSVATQTENELVLVTKPITPNSPFAIVLNNNKKRERLNPNRNIYLNVTPDMCWKCGYAGHKRFKCTGPKVIFCSRCGLLGRYSVNCGCPDRGW